MGLVRTRRPTSSESVVSWWPWILTRYVSQYATPNHHTITNRTRLREGVAGLAASLGEVRLASGSARFVLEFIACGLGHKPRADKVGVSCVPQRWDARLHNKRVLTLPRAGMVSSELAPEVDGYRCTIVPCAPIPPWTLVSLSDHESVLLPSSNSLSQFPVAHTVLTMAVF